MIKYFCDRCGDEVEKYSGVFPVTVQSPVVSSWPNVADAETGTYILCYNCVKELNKFIERKE